jgi:death-on-curing protein
MRYLTLGEVVALHRALLESSGGATGIRDLGSLESALAQPRATFGGVDLHASLAAKVAALGFSLALNHPFVDGNKRVAHAAMEVFLILNGHEIVATWRTKNSSCSRSPQETSHATRSPPGSSDISNRSARKRFLRIIVRERDLFLGLLHRRGYCSIRVLR